MHWYEEVEHTADWAFRVRGRSLQELFANAAHAMFSLERSVEMGKHDLVREVEVDGADRETLLVNWLNELLYLGQEYREAYGRVDILEINDGHLRALVHGRHEDEAQRYIKAVTFHNLELKCGSNGWEATLVLDV